MIKALRFAISPKKKQKKKHFPLLILHVFTKKIFQNQLRKCYVTKQYRATLHCKNFVSAHLCHVEFLDAVCTLSATVPRDLLLKAKRDGFSDRQVGQALDISEGEARALRLNQNIRPWVKQV